MKKLTPNPESKNQIEMDIARTFTWNEYFKEGSRGRERLRNVLTAFCCYDENVGYVQGMSFLMGWLIMHCSSTLAFWLFVDLVEECRIREIYQVGLAGLYKHSHIIHKLVEQEMPDLYSHFEENDVSPELYTNDWLFGFFATLIPEDETQVTAQFLTLFFRHKWEFFYKLALTLLEILRPSLLQINDTFCML